MIINRRRLLQVTSAAAAAICLPKLSLAANPTGQRLHGLSAFGDLKYAADFAAFDFAAPEAPNGGTFNFQPGFWFYNQNTQTFNTLNSFVRRGDAPPRMEYCYDSLMTDAWDEPDAIYCHVAEWVEIPEDGNRFAFGLRDIARWHDGTQITSDDVVFTYKALKEGGHPQLSLPLGPLVDVVASDKRTVELVFDGTQSAQDILLIAAYPILSSKWYETADFDASTLEPPLASGPYRVGRFNAGSFIEYDRVDDYWARQIGTGAGLGHFDTVRIEFYRERQAAFEAFKKGDITFRQEFTSKSWATEYNFPAVEDGRVIKQLFPAEKRPSMQSWCLNLRRERFQDRRVRDAIAHCFDFEWTNQNLFYGAYSRSQSLFGGSQYQAEGKPDEDETALINELMVAHEMPEGIFDDAFMQPVADGSGRDRTQLRAATKLLNEAGWTADEAGMMRNAAGEGLDVEFLIRASVFERIYGPFVEVMRAVGINASLRLVDPAQYQARLNDFDFDMAGMALSWTATPIAGDLISVLGSQSANLSGSRNLPGTADPLIDALIGRIGTAKSRKTHQTALRVLDRVLRLKREWIPNWRSANHRAAYWDMFVFKPEKLDYFWPVELLWWVDETKAKALGKL